jgi:hypothetical protein
MPILSLLYSKYFAKDKLLRHYAQHFLVGCLGYFLLVGIFNVPHTPLNFTGFLMTTYIIDLDGLIAVIRFQKDWPTAKMIMNSLNYGHVAKAANIAVRDHKKLNRLILHNVIGFGMVILLFILSVKSENITGMIVTGALFCHFVMDICDDYWQLGHINNWFWPVNFKKS